MDASPAKLPAGASAHNRTPRGAAVWKCLENRTARRIAIQSKSGAYSFVVPPFGQRKLDPLSLAELAYEPWEEANLIRVGDVEAAAGRDPVSVASLADLAILGCVVVVGPIAIIVARPDLKLWSAVTVAGILAALFLLRWRFLEPWIGQLGSLTSMLGIGFGLPTAYLVLESQRLGKLNEIPPIAYMLVAFIGIAAILPALLYYLFERQRLLERRETFLRDVVLLDPNLETLDDAETFYGPILNQVLGTVEGRDFLGGLQLSLLISTILVAMGWSITLLPTYLYQWPLPPGADLLSLFRPHPIPLTFGFLGVYFFSLNMVFRRYVRADLGPKAYTHVVARIFFTAILVWVVEQSAGFFNVDFPLGVPLTLPATTLLVVAFGVGIVPEVALTVVQDVLKRALGAVVPALREEHPVTDLEGLTLYDQARLLEEGIENVENLAHHNLAELMLRTRIPTPRLVDMVDQAILYLHVQDSAPPAGRQPDGSLARLRESGLRTATDLEAAQAAAAARGPEAEAKMLGLLDDARPGLSRLRLILDAMRDDEWMPCLRHWRDLCRFGEQAYGLEAFAPPPVRTQLPVAASPAIWERTDAPE
jgi:hypothetical protein